MLLRGEAWRGATADAPDQAQQLLQDALQKYQVGVGGAWRARGGCWSRLGDGGWGGLWWLTTGLPA